MQGVPHGFKAEGDNLPGALRIVAGEFDGGFRQRQKQGVAKGAVRLAEELLWSSFFGHADQMVGLCTGGQLGGRAGQRFVLCG